MARGRRRQWAVQPEATRSLMVLGAQVSIRESRASRRARELADAAALDRYTNCYVPKGPLTGAQASIPRAPGVRLVGVAYGLGRPLSWVAPWPDRSPKISGV